MPAVLAVPAAHPAPAAGGELARLEEAALNATTVREQMLYEGWLVRWAPSRAKRARCVNVLGLSTRPLDERLAYCTRWYAGHGVPLIVRLTSIGPDFSLDAQLHERGFVAFDRTCVMAAPVVPFTAQAPSGLVFERTTPGRFAQEAGRLRGHDDAATAEHAARLQAAPLENLPLLVRDASGECIAAGLAAFDAELVGLFDIVTAPQRRRQGCGAAVLKYLLEQASHAGARQAYLQVEPQNTAARALYARFGFVDRYTYWYRSMSEATPV
ncbi:GNAT family N-acetyltransferase [Bordetella bronchiseptica]|uniref:Acetyltransferase, GnaT family n=1 Tax=Bordetella bronchiseptica (strain ATCC BAA-588 / NCTC 13252 / RB50) TaxID=257310 RepID=A0A0H3LND9_BORBR|nr:GNAT family N-acetyltransferase [Bordetella bronchiseptica]KAK63448.1 FR47-like protein [Bordetella bronchiseptica 980-2]AMG86626.1 N-acetyltransferase [Bordetella bronchiseptica]AWP82558.1 N-acetyltransferase [Bordetella bronchiseptica]AWQ08126.1 N-acetyltransferase [Bordetella bronchiseptica]AXT91492.1 N-acetyltransferase [Bordetella bronchiseptica]